MLVQVAEFEERPLRDSALSQLFLDGRTAIGTATGHQQGLHRVPARVGLNSELAAENRLGV